MPNTNGISTPWQAPSPWLRAGSGWSNRYIQVRGPAPAASRASATRIAGTTEEPVGDHRGQQVARAGARVGVPGRPRDRRGGQAVPGGHRLERGLVDERRSCPRATRNSRASSRFEPISSGTPRPWPPRSTSAGARAARSPSTVGANGSRLSASCAPARGSGLGLHLDHQVRGRLHQLVQRHRLDRLPRRLARRARRPGSRLPSRRSSGVSVCAPAPLCAMACANRPSAAASTAAWSRSSRPPTRRRRSPGPGRRRTPRCCPAPTRSAATWSSSPRLASPSSGGVAGEQEALGAEPVVDRDADDAVAGERGAVVLGDRPGAVHERAAVDPHQHGQPARRTPGRASTR